MRKLYALVTKGLDTNLLGILIGLETGVLINIVTGQKEINHYYWAAVALMLLAAAALLAMARWRQSMDREAERFSDLSMGDEERWRACDLYGDKVIRFGYLLAIIVCLAGNYFAVKEIRAGNNIETIAARKTEDELNDRLNKVIKMEQRLLDLEAAKKMDTLKKVAPAPAFKPSVIPRATNKKAQP